MSNKNSFRRNSVTYRMSCHAIGHFVFWCHHVTYSRSCHTSGHLMIYRESFFTQAFFTLHSFLLVLRLSWGRQFNLKVSRASCRSWKHSPGPAIRLNHNNPLKNLPLARFELFSYARSLMLYSLPQSFVGCDRLTL